MTSRIPVYRLEIIALATAEGRGAITTEDSIVDKGDVPEGA